MRVDAETDRQRALRVEVDQQHLAAVLGQRGAEVDRGRGLADAALLVAHRDDAGRAVVGASGAGLGIGPAAVGPVGPDHVRRRQRARLPGQSRRTVGSQVLASPMRAPPISSMAVVHSRRVPADIASQALDS